jgi:hypothetical protein
MHSLADLRSASASFANIPEKFGSLPNLRQDVYNAHRKLQYLAQKVLIAEASPEEFWYRNRILSPSEIAERTAKAETEAAAAAASASGEVQAATPELLAPVAVPEGVIKPVESVTQTDNVTPVVETESASESSAVPDDGSSEPVLPASGVVDISTPPIPAPPATEVDAGIPAAATP